SCEQYYVQKIEPAAHAMINKLSKYIQILLLKPPAIFASILDPQFKIKLFTSHESTLARFGLLSHKLQ
ncbi:hypothetical protein O181_108110, partial [Austropuccinia psidii MF-1]|nr:hypothetical protein [Austropuccinia psidii MF-1]